MNRICATHAIEMERLALGFIADVGSNPVGLVVRDLAFTVRTLTAELEAALLVVAEADRMPCGRSLVALEDVLGVVETVRRGIKPCDAT